MNKQQLRAKIAALQDATMDENKNFRTAYDEGKFDALSAVDALLDSLQEEPVSELWHDASEEPNDMSHCLIFYGCKESVGHYLHYEPVLYNKKEKMFVTSSFPHPTGNKVEQKSFDGGCVAEVYKDKRNRISISDITQWCYLCDLHNLSNVERTVKDWKEEPVAPKVLEDMLNAKTAAESLGISQEEHDRIVDELIYGKEPELVDVDDLSNKEKEPASEDLEEAANDYAHDLLHDDVFLTFIAGAKWQKEHLWKPADGDDLPEIDRVVIVLYQPYPLENSEYAVIFAHRPPEYWDGRNIETDEVTRYYPERYEKGGWNIPDVKFWLDCELPKTMEE